MEYAIQAQDIALPTTVSNVAVIPTHRHAYLDLGQVEPDPEQVRKHFEPEPLANLAGSLRQFGQLVPIITYFDAERGRHVIFDGERRYRAAKEAGLSRLESVIFDHRPTPLEVATVQLSIDLQRESLDAIDQARGFAHVMEGNGWNASELASHVHIAVSSVTRALALLALPTDLQEAIRTRELIPAIARELARLPEESQRRAMWHRVKEEGLTSKEVQKLVSDLLKPRKKGKAKAKDRQTYRNLGGFEAVVTPKLVTLRPMTTTKAAKTPEQIIAGLEMLLMRLRQDVASGQTQNPGSPA